MRTFISILFTCVFAFQIQAKPDNEKCEGTYSYTFSKSISLEEGEARAVENAVIMALADKFGTNVTSQSLMEMSNDYDRFMQLSQLAVKGKLVKHIKQPKVSEPVFKDNLISVDVTVCFYAQPIEHAPIEFKAIPLRNGTEDVYEAQNYIAGDRFYMSFTTPKNGYVAVFFDDGKNVTCMLPYVANDNSPFYAKKNKRYLFFTDDNDTYNFVCGAEPEINYLHVVYSPNKFINGDLVRDMSSKDLQKWLGNRRSYDEELEVESIMIRVTPKED